MKLSPNTTFTATMIGVAFVVMATVGGVAWTEARDSVLDTQFANLASIRNSKSRQVESYFETTKNQLIVQSEDISTVSAMVELNRGFRELEQRPIDPAFDASLETYYTDEFFPRLGENLTSGLPAYSVFRPSHQSARYLQHHYIAANSDAVGFKQFLDDAGDGSTYSEAHQLYHPNLRHLVERNGYYDLFMIDAETGDIVYSVFKEVDYGTNLLTGPYRNSALASAVTMVMEDPIPRTAQTVDYEPYLPSYNAAGAFIAAPIFNGEHVVGILAIQIPTDRINDIMASDGQWVEEGMGATGQTYLVGSDQTMRSDSRFLSENPERFLSDLVSTGAQERIVSQIEQLDSTVLLQRIDTEATRSALAGTTDTRLALDYRATDVLASFGPVSIDGLDWAIVSEIDADEAFAPVDRLLRYLFISAAIVTPLIALASVWAARRFMRPASRLVGVADAILAAEEMPVDKHIDAFDFDESGPGQFGTLGSRLNLIAERVRSQSQVAEQFNVEYADLLKQSVPFSAAERRQKGEGSILDATESAAAIAIRLTDFPVVGPDGDFSELVQLRADIDADLSRLADAHGIDLFSNVGMEYVGLCGLTMRFINFAERSIDFAIATVRVVASYNQSHGTNLGVRVGIDASEMVGTLIDQHKTTYDVLGPAIGYSQQMLAVTAVDTLALSNSLCARLDEVQLTEATEVEVTIDGEQVTLLVIAMDLAIELRDGTAALAGADSAAGTGPSSGSRTRS